MVAARSFPESVTRHSYWLAVALPLLLPLAWFLREVTWIGAAFVWLPLVILYVLIPLVDLLVGRDLHNPDPAQRDVYRDSLIPVLAGLSYLGALAWSLSISPRIFADHGGLALVGWILSLGDIGGAVGINVAHELIHRKNRWLSGLGGLMLAAVWYPGFKLEHPRWHHVHVSTPNDPSSAARGDTVYGQVPRAIVLNTVQGWKLGRDAAARAGRAFPGLMNETAYWYLVSFALTVGAGLAWGWLAVGVLVGQGIMAAVLLEIINYVEHYGLRRERRADGRFVPPGVTHSWDCDFWLSNAMLIQLPRHADHHTHPSRPYGALQKNPTSPLLPLGYPVLVLIALVPPLWRRVIHPHLPEERETAVANSG